MKTAVKTVNERISNQVKAFTPEEVSILKSTVAKGTTDIELAYFLNVAKVYGLNPFTKQIWCYKDNKGNVIVFAGRDGFLAKAQMDSRWSGIASDVVRDGETFSMNVAEGKISHEKDITSKAKIIGAYARCKPKGCTIETIEWADFDTYNKGYNVWKADPVAMIKKVAESHCLSKAYGISGLAVEEDFDVKGDVVITRDHEGAPTTTAIMCGHELIRTCTGDEDYKSIMEAKLNDTDITNIELENIIKELRMNQPKKY